MLPAKLMMFEGLIVIFAVAIVVCVNGLNLSLAPTDTFAVCRCMHRHQVVIYCVEWINCLLFHKPSQYVWAMGVAEQR